MNIPLESEPCICTLARAPLTSQAPSRCNTLLTLGRPAGYVDLDSSVNNPSVLGELDT